jgi:hypothetical protein
MNRVNKVLIGDGVNSAAFTSLKVTNGPTIAAGDLVLVKADGTVVETNAAAAALSKHDPVYIAMGTATGLSIQSGPIVPKNVTAFKGKAYSAPAEQITYIGYNTSTGAITVSNSTEYVLNITIKDEMRVMSHRPSAKKYNFVTDSTATVIELCNGLLRQSAKDAINNLVKVEMVTDGSFTVLGGSSTLAVTKGSKTAIASSGSHGLVAGDLVRIGGTGASVPVYQVENVATTTITLAVPYQGTSATVANANVGEMSSVTAYGIKITGIAVPFNNIDYYQKVSFTTSLAPINGVIGDQATVTYSTKMALGSGYYQQVRDMEYKAQGYLGVTNRTAFPNDELQYTSLFKYSSSANYHLIVIEAFDEHEFFLQNQGKSPVSTVIAIPDGHQATANAQVIDGTDENFAYILSGLFVTNLGFDALPAMT